MNGLPLHIVAFDNPWPPDYGGAIDVFWKLKSLAEAGCAITLHAFSYGREPAPELQRWCRRLHWYPRRSALVGMISDLPYVVSSRADVNLLDNLLTDNAPILFEGLHTCYYLDDPQLSMRRRFVRMHNIEWQYYRGLAEVERTFWKEWYFRIEARRLKRFERVLTSADRLLAISPGEAQHYAAHFPATDYLPAFHPNEQLRIRTGRGAYALYHGNLSVPENVQAASFLIDRVFRESDIPLIVAGKDPDYKLYEMLERAPNVTLVPNPEADELDGLLREAHVNVLPTFQGTGIKLKLIHTLFNGRFCVVNRRMVEGSGLAPYCIVADDAEAMRGEVERLFECEFGNEELRLRADLPERFSNRRHAAGLRDALFAPR